MGQNAHTEVKGVNVKSPRQVSSAALRDMEVPRLERYIQNNRGIYITYMPIAEFGWDRLIPSDWLLPVLEEDTGLDRPPTLQTNAVVETHLTRQISISERLRSP